MVRVKICCITTCAEAALAVRAGASAVGLVSGMPSGPGVISESLIAEIAAWIPPGVSTFLLTSRTDPDEIAAQQKRCRTNTIQLCDALEPEARGRLRVLLPGVSIVQVVHVTGPESLSEARAAAAHSDALLLDSGTPNGPVRELGGTGRRHDWSVSRAIREEVALPVFLAGGLNPGNVAEAVRTVDPFGVDVCSGLRTGGSLDEERLDRFFENLRGTPGAMPEAARHGRS